jgi:trehalose 6-phosphate phosphatase
VSAGEPADRLAAIAEARDRAAIMLDFDGTLAPLVPHPDLARPAEGVRELLAGLVDRFRVVAVISGRPVADLRAFLGVEGVRYEGLYGLQTTAPADDTIHTDVDMVARTIPGAWVEPKGVTIAVHYRQALDTTEAREQLAEALGVVGRQYGYDLLEGKMVFELAPAGESRKGGAVERLLEHTNAEAALYAGDDLPDLEAFAALDTAAETGLRTVKIAVGGAETPAALRADADLVVEGPAGLVTALRALL